MSRQWKMRSFGTKKKTGPSQSTCLGACCRWGMLPSVLVQATPSAGEVVSLWFGSLLLPIWNNACWSQKNCVNCCMIPRTKTESMVCLWSWLRRICTPGVMQWKSFRKKLKVSSSSRLTNSPASCTVVGSNSPDDFKTLNDVTFVLKNSVHGTDMEVPFYSVCSWDSVCHHSVTHTGSLERSWKKSRESSQVREELINWWYVRCHLLHDESRMKNTLFICECKLLVLHLLTVKVKNMQGVHWNINKSVYLLKG